ncbi:hypothetical protein TXIAM_140208 [Tenacibaculum xiamenense]
MLDDNSDVYAKSTLKGKAVYSHSFSGNARTSDSGIVNSCHSGMSIQKVSYTETIGISKSITVGTTNTVNKGMEIELDGSKLAEKLLLGIKVKGKIEHSITKSQSTQSTSELTETKTKEQQIRVENGPTNWEVRKTPIYYVYKQWGQFETSGQIIAVLDKVVFTPFGGGIYRPNLVEKISIKDYLSHYNKRSTFNKFLTTTAYNANNTYKMNSWSIGTCSNYNTKCDVVPFDSTKKYILGNRILYKGQYIFEVVLENSRYKWKYKGTCDN